MEKLFYKTISQSNEFEIPKIKWSRFIGNVFPITSKEDAENYLKTIQTKYRDATHNCYAYVCGTKVNYDLFGKLEITPEHFKYSDEGEPANTAGKPILAQIQGHGLHNTLVVITRYFGGTMLGIGWLIQAYGDCAKQTIEHSQHIEQEIIKTLKFSYDFDLVPIVRNITNKYNAKIVNEVYDKAVDCEIHINTWYFEAFKKDILNHQKKEWNVVFLDDWVMPTISRNFKFEWSEEIKDF